MSDQYSIPEDALEFRHVLASGPGGQHVNKTSSAVELRVTLSALALPEATTHRLLVQQRGRINKQGQLVIQADNFRSQLRNRNDALSRLERMIAEASKQPKKRIPTKPSRSAKRKRSEGKKQRGQTKSQRKKPRLDS